MNKRPKKDSTTFVFATSYIPDENTLVNRYYKWIDYYLKYFHTLHLIDDGSPIKFLKAIKRKYKRVIIHTFDTHLGRPTLYQVYGWLRSFNESLRLAKEYNCDKIIHIESDLFIFNTEMIDCIKDVKEEWHIAFDMTWSVPESSLQVINKDQFDWFEWYTENNFDFIDSNPSGFENHVNLWYKQVEFHVPHTNILKTFQGGRHTSGVFYWCEELEKWSMVAYQKDNSLGIGSTQVYTKPLDYISNFPVDQKLHPDLVH